MKKKSRLLMVLPALLVTLGVGPVLLGLISASAMAQMDTAGELEMGVAIALDAAKVEASRIQLTPPQTKKMNKVIRDLRRGKNEAALIKWENLVTDLVFEGSPIDSFALIHWVIRQSYLEQIDELRFMADSVKYFNSQKNAIRESIRRARAYRGLLKKLNQPTAVIDSEIESLNAYVARLGDDAQLRQLELQQALQRQTQIIQSISNIMKIWNDAIKAIISNFK